MANPIPEGVICGWPSTVASIPEGWDRNTDLDSKYVRAIPDNETDPGDTGGAVSHEHNTPGHVHALDHSHGSATSASSSASGGGGNDPGDPLIGVAVGTHHHSFSLASQSVNSQSAAPDTDAVGNDPAHLEVIWIESDGTPTEFPEGALTFCSENVVPDGNTIYADGNGLFLKGAATSSDGGSIEAGTLEEHDHEVEAHTHTGTSHTHSNATSGGNNSNNSVENNAGGIVISAANHTHTVTPTSASTGDLSSASGGTTGEESPLPPYIDLLVIESDGISPKYGMIAMWDRPLSEIPEGWLLCDGENDTPNLCQGLFPRGTDDTGEIGDTGGTDTHTHSDPDPHSHTIGSHNHATTWGTTTTISRSPGSGPSSRVAQHSTVHNANSASATPTAGSISAGTISTESHIPEYRTVAFIMSLGTSGANFWLFF